ncbi:hypothetical protein GUITHDRAFT_122586 [Guillardia theta CCMP2712]|uniref:t-SNARE coiled-coil homology domain-containing protein n=1 Tax=Guillardia theta (strain CCMP2712) TaxID=905079 RepID=L1I548_GUITC|nr:hypothetical protein GUITHDRAFT_122586 [Guillardia theta CCMP2712]EKX31217.1 hypothetical protein GUITHDRAFT_122586 [Guillardia theta CCMP2712]|eukprot:XP_005818197.1 hypothetical protein GUITHDRAFT_122586 [Guillardia theta CCMP2712]
MKPLTRLMRDEEDEEDEINDMIKQEPSSSSLGGLAGKAEADRAEAQLGGRPQDYGAAEKILSQQGQTLGRIEEKINHDMELTLQCMLQLSKEVRSLSTRVKQLTDTAGDSYL